MESRYDASRASVDRTPYQPPRVDFALADGRGVWLEAHPQGLAEEVARRWNSHPALLAALEDGEAAIMSLMDETADMKETEGGRLCWEFLHAARAALKAATGEGA